MRDSTVTNELKKETGQGRGMEVEREDRDKLIETQGRTGQGEWKIRTQGTMEWNGGRTIAGYNNAATDIRKRQRNRIWAKTKDGQNYF